VIGRHLTNVGRRAAHDLSAIHVQQVPLDEVAVSEARKIGYAAPTCRLHVSFDGPELPFPG
jgi:hypothetical protein